MRVERQQNSLWTRLEKKAIEGFDPDSGLAGSHQEAIAQGSAFTLTPTYPEKQRKKQKQLNN